MMLSYRGQPLAEIVPTASAPEKLSPLEALNRLHARSKSFPDATSKADAYLKQLREEQRAWGERSST